MTTIKPSQGERIRQMIEHQGPVGTGSLAVQMGVSRQAVHHHLLSLLSGGEIERVGGERGRSVKYRSAADHRWDLDVQPGDREDHLWQRVRDEVSGAGLNENALAIHEYVFAEVVNNVIDHSGSASLRIAHRNRNGVTQYRVQDTGVGVFQHVANASGDTDLRMSALRLQGGRFTSDPENHTGQGLFFSSRTVDHFSVASSTVAWVVNNRVGDSTIGSINFLQGTEVTWELDNATARSLTGLFEAHSTLDEDGVPRFSKTEIAVRVASVVGSVVTRSVARQLLEGKEAFDIVILDFEGITSLGQAFADQTFRVFANQHPETEVIPVNMARDVAFFVAQARGA